jgi:DtxR family Mn-dependent transcriptional regulator
MNDFTWIIIAIVVIAAGLIGRRVWQHYQTLRQREQVEDALKHLHACEWRGSHATLDSLCGALRLSAANAVDLLTQMEQGGLLRTSTDGLRLTPEGERMALAIIRAHRLLERYLADEARMPLAQVHTEAERREHELSPAAIDAMDAALGYPSIDPHGDPIPSASGELARRDWQPLPAWPTGTLARIVHLEDEPPSVFAQIAAMGLRPGQIVQVIESNAQRLVLSDGNLTHTLAPIVAANIFVVADNSQALAAVKRLSSLKPGQQATVYALVESLQGFTRRRLLDLGMTPGARITAEMTSMFRDPMAYRVRGTLIALRREQADLVLIKDQIS